MNINEILKKYKCDNYPRVFEKSYPDLYKIINDNWSFHDTKFNEKLYYYVNNISPMCKHGKLRRFASYTKGYMEFGIKCKNCRIEINNKVKKTNLERHGNENIALCVGVIEKKRNTSLEKYNSEYAISSKIVKEKIKNTIHSNPDHYKNVQEKIKETCINTYGYESTFQVPEFAKKIDKTNLERYGDIIPSKTQSIKDKISNSHKKDYVNFHKRYKDISEESKNIIYDKENFINFIKNKSRKEISEELNVSVNLINVKMREYDINDYHGYENEFHNIFEDIKINQRNIITPYEIDVFLEKYNIGIEINGNYWHSELAGGKDKNYHINKSNMCEKKGIKLFHIFEDEWLYKKNIWISLIKSNMNLNNKIYARKCKILEIKNNEAVRFCNENHIQGGINSKYNYGLYFENNLVAVMTFGKNRIALGNKSENYELLRYCSIINYNIVGGASKLFKYFINEVKPKEIISYANVRYSSGKLYRALNFEYIGKTEPSYWYIDNKNCLKRYHRFNFRKNILVKNGNDKTKSGWEIMQELDFDRIWDCGNYKFIWKSDTN